MVRGATASHYDQEVTLLDDSNMNQRTECGYKNGALPSCAPLASSYTPMQESSMPRYESEEALTRGTLFPGLDLPFKNIINKSHPCAGTPMGELMALQFMIKELQLYLDTHPDDMETFRALKNVIELEKQGRERYVRLYGPLVISDVEFSDSYTWINGPWPWENEERTR